MIAITVYTDGPADGADTMLGTHTFDTPEACVAWLRAEGIDQPPSPAAEFTSWLHFVTYDNGSPMTSAHPDESRTDVDQWRAVWEALTA